MFTVVTFTDGFVCRLPTATYHWMPQEAEHRQDTLKNIFVCRYGYVKPCDLITVVSLKLVGRLLLKHLDVRPMKGT